MLQKFEILAMILGSLVLLFSFIRTIRENVQYIGHMHTAGNPERRDLDEEQELYYPAIMRAIAETGYDFYIGHEFTPRHDRLAALRVAFETCNVG